jgi:hypothetical protein
LALKKLTLVLLSFDLFGTEKHYSSQVNSLDIKRARRFSQSSLPYLALDNNRQVDSLLRIALPAGAEVESH